MSHTDPKDNQILKLQKENERLKKELTKFAKDKGWLSFNAAAEFRKVF